MHYVGLNQNVRLSVLESPPNFDGEVLRKGVSEAVCPTGNHPWLGILAPQTSPTAVSRVTETETLLLHTSSVTPQLTPHSHFSVFSLFTSFSTVHIPLSSGYSSSCLPHPFIPPSLRKKQRQFIWEWWSSNRLIPLPSPQGVQLCPGSVTPTSPNTHPHRNGRNTATYTHACIHL